jgi:hypothetical protein
MKAKPIITAAILAMLTVSSFSQGKAKKDYVWQYPGRNKTHTLGLYGGISGSYSPVMDQSAGWLSARAGIVFDHRFGIGVTGSALSFDRTLSEVVEDGTYHLEAGYAGLFAEYLQPIGKNLKVVASLTSAMGTTQYRYDKEYREGRPWYEEIIDKAEFHLFEPGIEFQARLSRNWWIGANATYRFTSPVEMEGASNDLLQNYTAGISLKYGIF